MLGHALCSANKFIRESKDVEAKTSCYQALALQEILPLTYEALGDLYAKHGNPEAAFDLYSTERKMLIALEIPKQCRSVQRATTKMMVTDFKLRQKLRPALVNAQYSEDGVFEHEIVHSTKKSHRQTQSVSATCSRERSARIQSKTMNRWAQKAIGKHVGTGGVSNRRVGRLNHSASSASNVKR